MHYDIHKCHFTRFLTTSHPIVYSVERFFAGCTCTGSTFPTNFLRTKTTKTVRKTAINSRKLLVYFTTDVEMVI